MKKTKMVLILVLVVCLTAVVYATRFGGFYGPGSSATKPPVQAFLDEVDEYSGHTTSGPRAAYKSSWDTSNNTATTGVDDYEFTYSCQHGAGSWWTFETHNGDIDLDSSGFGGSSHNGWGDDRVNWLVLYSCSVIAASIDVSDWWSVWMANNPYDVMDGVHMVMGFRTDAWVAPAQNVSTHYAEYICTGGKILLKWFHAVWYYSYCQTTSLDKACAVFSPGSQNDKLTSYSSDPAPYSLYCWYYD